MSTALVFRALLSNGFTDNNGAVLNSFRYMGRGEEFHTYQGFTRQISFSFKIAVFSRAELQPLYNKLNYLISQVYPDYSSNTNIMRAPLVKVTVGDYLYRVPGFLESVNVTADNNTPWEINLENSSDVQELPHVLDVAISFKPIHSVLPQRSAYKNYQASGSISGGDSFTPLIGNSFIKHASEVNTMSNLPITPIPMFSTQISNQTNLQPLQVPGAAEQNASQQVNSASPYPLIDISGIIPMGKI
jgi:hypothetical protein